MYFAMLLVDINNMKFRNAKDKEMYHHSEIYTGV